MTPSKILLAFGIFYKIERLLEKISVYHKGNFSIYMLILLLNSNFKANFSFQITPTHVELIHRLYNKRKCLRIHAHTNNLEISYWAKNRITK